MNLLKTLPIVVGLFILASYSVVTRAEDGATAVKKDQKISVKQAEFVLVGSLAKNLFNALKKAGAPIDKDEFAVPRIIVKNIFAGTTKTYDKNDNVSGFFYDLTFETKDGKEMRNKGRNAELLTDYLESLFPASQDGGTGGSYFQSSEINCTTSKSYSSCTLLPIIKE
jgi:hypothetical protein